MSEEFFGDWTLEVIEKEAAFSERFVIDGSDASDGVYPGETTTPPLAVTGARWRVTLEWNDNAGSGWQPSDVRRTGAAYTLQDGLVIVLGADDNFPQFRDEDYDDVVLRCTSNDPRINPWHPFINPYDFTLPRDVRDRGGPLDRDDRFKPNDPCGKSPDRTSRSA
jgi:hypothetical protein